MDKRSHIRAVEGAVVGEPQDVQAPASTLPPVEDDVEASDLSVENETWEEPAPIQSHGISRWLPAVFFAVIIGWTALFGWSHRNAMLGGATAAQWVDWIATWAVPVLLVLAIWLLMLRSSAREAARFADVARTLSEESATLESRLATVNRELSLAREFLATQSRELNYFGRAAAEGLTRHAETLDNLLKDNGSRFEAIEGVSANALANMESLRDQLPVIGNSSRDVSNQIGNAGRVAQEQLDSLIDGFERLNEFGSASERQVVSLQERVDDALQSLTVHSDTLAGTADERFTHLKAEVEAFRARITEADNAQIEEQKRRAEAMRAELSAADEQTHSRGEAALALLRTRLDDLRSDFDAMHTSIDTGQTAARAALSTHMDEIEDRHIRIADQLAQRNQEIAAGQDRALIALGAKLTELDEAIALRQASHREQLDALASDSEAVAARITSAGETFDIVSSQAREAQGALADAVERLSATLGESREALDGTDMAIAALTDSSVRLLELLQASARQTRTEIPEALAGSEDRLAEIKRRAGEISGLLTDAQNSGNALAETIDGIEPRTRDALDQVDRLQSAFGEHAGAQHEEIDRLRASIAALGEENKAVAASAQGELREAIAILETATREAFAAISDDQDSQIRRLADRVGEQSAAAIDAALAEHLHQAVASLDQARERSSEAGRETAEHLRDQLAKVNELAESLETRVARARSEAQERVDNDFSRRVALITESLNSSSIDVAKALSTDVSDTAWASYLRGDRGIFTRRAVRLIENSEAREIVTIYNDDADFRDHVNRYIHDFEAMLRTLLSTRDGNALSVTMLSSDMGKLYVILAQALERLRQ